MKIRNIIQSSLLLLSLTAANPLLANTNVSSDSSINSAVKSKIAADAALKNTKLKVTTHHSVVYLQGNLESDAEASQAAELAQSVNGVKDVDTSKLMVKGSDQLLADSLITSKIKGLFIQQKLFGDNDVAAMTISVETTNGVVTLTGEADNQEQADTAEKIARSVSGVKEVKSSIKIVTKN